MSAETEIERLVVRLIGENELSVSLEDASKTVGKLSEEMDKALSDIEKDLKDLDRATDEVVLSMSENLQALGGQLQLAGVAMTVGVTAPLAAMGAFSVAQFSEMEAGMIKLEAAVTSNGREVSSTMAQYTEFASEMQQLTTIGDDTTLSYLKTAEAYDLTGHAAKGAVKDAISLAAVNDTNAASMLRMTAAMASGDIKRAMLFARMIPQLRGVKDETEFLEKYTRLVAGGFAQAQAEAQSLTGQLAQLNNDFGDLGEEIGAIIAEVIMPFVKMLKEIVHWFQALSPEMKRTLVLLGALAAAIGPVLVTIGTLIVTLGVLSASMAALGITSVAAGVAMLAALWPVYLIAAVIAAAIGGIAYAYSSATEEARAFEKATKAANEVQINTGARSDRDQIQAEIQKKAEEFKALVAAQEEATKSAKELVAQYKEQIMVFGMSSREAEIYKLNQMGANETEIKQLEALNLKLTAMEKAAEATKVAQKAVEDLQKSTESFTEKLQFQVATFGMTSREAELYKLQMEGAGLMQLSAARAADKELSALEKQKSLMEKGKQLTKEFATPLEKFSEREGELRELLEAGAIGADTFGLAMKEAQTELDKVAGVHDVDFKVNGVDAVAAGSAEAMARVAEFQSSSREARLAASQNVATSTFANQPKQASIVAAQNGFFGKPDQAITDVAAGITRLVELAEADANAPTITVEAANL